MKPKSDIQTQDSRSALSATSIDEVHGYLDQLSLSRRVPQAIAELVETAKNLSLYAWYVYDFHPVAELVGFQALELAVRKRAEIQGISIKKRSFRSLMNIAVENGWIVESDMPNRLEIARARIEQRRMINSMRSTGCSMDGSIRIESPTDTEILDEARQMKIAKSVCDAAVKLRNGLAHCEH